MLNQEEEKQELILAPLGEREAEAQLDKQIHIQTRVPGVSCYGAVSLRPNSQQAMPVEGQRSKSLTSNESHLRNKSGAPGRNFKYYFAI